MIGSSFVGGRFLGVGRSLKVDYTELSAQVGLSAGLSVDTLRVARDIYASIEVSQEIIGHAATGKRLYAVIESQAEADFSVNRRAGLFSELDLSPFIESDVTRRRSFRTALSEPFLVGVANQRLMVDRRRGMTAPLHAIAEADAPIGRRRGMDSEITALVDINKPLTNRARFLDAKLTDRFSIFSRVGRARPFSAAMNAFAGLVPTIQRFRGFSATLIAKAKVSGEAIRGRMVSGAIKAAALLAGLVRLGFRPSVGARRIFVAPKLRGLSVTPKQRIIKFTGDDMGLNMQERVKQPAEVVDYTIDMREWFRGLENDEIDDVEISIDIQGDPDDLMFGEGTLPVWGPVGDPVHEAKIWLSRGRDGVEYQVTCKITTKLKRVEKVDLLIRIERQRK